MHLKISLKFEIFPRSFMNTAPVCVKRLKDVFSGERGTTAMPPRSADRIHLVKPY